MTDAVPMDPQEWSRIIPPDVTNYDSHATYDYASILNKNCRISKPISSKVHVYSGNTNNTTVTTDWHSAIPFLTAGSEKVLPKYSRKHKNNVN